MKSAVEMTDLNLLGGRVNSKKNYLNYKFIIHN